MYVKALLYIYIFKELESRQYIRYANYYNGNICIHIYSLGLTFIDVLLNSLWDCVKKVFGIS